MNYLCRPKISSKIAEDWQMREGQDQVIEMGPGAGTIDGYIPYNRVVGSYAEAAAAAAESSGLSDSARQWANDYFSALTK